MTSVRKRKQQARARGLTAAELSLCELLEQVLAALRWQMVLGYANQYLVYERLQVPADERERIMRAAATAVDADARLQGWGQQLAAIRQQSAAVDAAVQQAPPPAGPPTEGVAGTAAGEAADGA